MVSSSQISACLCLPSAKVYITIPSLPHPVLIIKYLVWPVTQMVAFNTCWTNRWCPFCKTLENIVGHTTWCWVPALCLSSSELFNKVSIKAGVYWPGKTEDLWARVGAQAQRLRWFITSSMNIAGDLLALTRERLTHVTSMQVRNPADSRVGSLEDNLNQ